MNRKISLLKVIFCWMLVFSMVTGTSLGTAVAAQPAPWTAQIRPGISIGTGGETTDFNTDLFIPITGNKQYLLYFNPNMRIDDDSGNEQNFGLGYRGLMSGDKLIFGLNAYFDTMRSRHDNRYNQLGVGVEVLSHWLDFRANYYHPLSNPKKRVDGSDEYKFGSHSIILHQGYEEALNGADAEVGVLIPGISDFMETRAFFGGFWYDSEIADNIEGLKGRIELRPARLINLTAEVRHDDFRGTDTFFGGYLDIPFSIENIFQKKNPFEGVKDALAFGKGARSMSERMVEKVIRDPHITTITSASKSDTKKAVKDMIYVNQDNDDYYDDRDGSLQHPWESVEEAESRDSRWVDAKDGKNGAWVYVFSSDDSADTYLNNHTELMDGMVFWGQGYYHPVLKLGGNNGMTDPDMNPILDGNINDPVVTLADNNEVMGLTIQNGYPHGIYGSNIKSTYIHDNIIKDNVEVCSGIHIENYFDSADMSRQTLSYRFVNNRILNNEGSGIYLKNEITGSDNITGLTINTEFINNVIDGTYAGNSTYGTAIYVSNDISLSRDVDGSSGSTLSIADLNINNTFIGNILGEETGNEGNGIRLKNNITTELTVNGYVNGNSVFTSSIGDSHINNTFVDNDIYMMTADRDGIKVDNVLGADPIVTGTVDGSTAITAKVTDSGIKNNLLGNNVTFDNNVGGNGIDIYNDMYAYNEINEISDVGTGDVVDIKAYVKGSSINNTLAGNTITYGSNSGGTGILLNNGGEENCIAAETYIGDGENNHTITDIYGKAVVDLTAYVENSSINNTLAGNTVTYGSNSDGTGIYINNDLYAEIYNDGIIGCNDYDAAEVNLTAYVKNSSINNTLTGNTVTYNSNAYSNGIAINNYLSAAVYNDDYIGCTIYDDVQVNLTAYVENSSINNTLSGNMVTYGSFSSGTGIDIYNDLYAYVDAYGEEHPAIYSIHDDAQVNLTAYVEKSEINNTVSGNSVTYGSSSSGTGIDVYNNLRAEDYINGDDYSISNINDNAQVNLTAYIEKSNINNTVSGNSVTYGSNASGIGIDIFNHIEAEIDVDDGIGSIYDYAILNQTAYVEKSSINNTLTSNILNGSSFGSSDGIHLNNNIYNRFDDTNYSNMAGLLSNVSIINYLDFNEVYNFGDDGIDIDDYIYGDDYTDVNKAKISNILDGNILQGNSNDGFRAYGQIAVNSGNVMDSSATYLLKNNTMSNNGGDGIQISSGSDDYVDVNVRMYRNKVYDNDDYGVTLNEYNNADWYIDLGTKENSSKSGYNTFYGNVDYDFENNTGETANAMYNYWNGVEPVGETGGPVNYTPWLLVDPNP